MNLLDLIAAQEARDEAVERVAEHASPEWMARIERLVMFLAVEHPEGFTTDDVWQYCEEHGIESPHEPRALGAIFLKLAREGAIVKTGRYITSRRRVCHASPKAEWRLK